MLLDLADRELHTFVDELCAENNQNGSLQKTTDPRRYAAMLISGVKHLHKNSIIHRDVKPGNVLRFESDSRNYILKINDFEISKILEGTNYARSTNAGTTRYMAPEVAITLGKYTKDVDLWSLGLVLYYLCTGSINDKYCFLVNVVLLGSEMHRKFENL